MQQTAAAHPKFGDAAVDGLLAGVGAGLLMAGYLVAAGLAYGDGIATTLSRFDPAAANNPVTGLLAHLAVAGIYGVLFGIGNRFLSRAMRSVWVRAALGAAYGLALYAIAAGVLVPAWGEFLQAVPAGHFLVAHLLYGTTAGLLLGLRRGH